MSTLHPAAATHDGDNTATAAAHIGGNH